MKNFLILIILISPFCFIPPEAQSFECRPTDCLQQLPSMEAFKALAGQAKIGAKSADVVKIVAKKEQQGWQLFFVNTKRYSYHYDFVSSKLDSKIRLDEFNLNYTSPYEKRDYVLASLALWPKTEGTDKEQFLLELWSGDNLGLKGMQALYQKVISQINIAEMKTVFHPLGQGQEQIVFETSGLDLPVITTSQLYQGIDYLAMNEGEAVGRLVLGDEIEQTCFDHTNIVLFKRVPNDIGVVGGIITEEMQTPLGHINVKSMNRGTANMVLKNAKALLSPYVGKIIRLKMSGLSYTVEEIGEENGEKLIYNFWKSRRPHVAFNNQTLEIAENDTQFVNLQSLFSGQNIRPSVHKKFIKMIGAKATNLALLNYLETRKNKVAFFVPDAMAVPFNFYTQFMNYQQSGLDPNFPDRVTNLESLIKEKLTAYGVFDSEKEVSFCAVRPALKEIRDLVARSQIPPELLMLFKKNIVDDPSSPIHQSKIAKLRLRSSTNSEDLEGFNGAGLYNSTGLWLYGKEKTSSQNEAAEEEIHSSQKPLSWDKIEKKLKEKIPFVYSSVWNDRAFEEREWYGINRDNHMQIKVAIALHEGVPYLGLDGVKNEVANGVAMTTNIFNNQETDKVYLNSQHFDLAVTNPPTLEELLARDPLASLSSYQSEELMVSAFSAKVSEGNDPRYYANWSYETMAHSSLLNGTPVLQDGNIFPDFGDKDEVRELALVLTALESQFLRVSSKPDQFSLDVEWKLVGPERKIWIKQARPFAKMASPKQGDSAMNAAMLQPEQNPRGKEISLGPKIK